MKHFRNVDVTCASIKTVGNLSLINFAFKRPVNNAGSLAEVSAISVALLLNFSGMEE